MKIKNDTTATKQPQGLYLLFFTELWERFGYYTLQTIIILYMTKGLALTDTNADLLYASFSSLLFLTPAIGGYLADRYLGFQRAIILGGVLLIVGYIASAFQNENIFFLGLSILICGNGFFKPNVSSIVGELYGENDPRRDGGFTIFYMGINLGSLVPPLIAGALVVKYGWHAGFILAAIGMTIGQVIFILGRKKLGNAGLKPYAQEARPALTKSFWVMLWGGIFVVIALCELALNYPATTSYLIEIAAVGIFIMVIWFSLKEQGNARHKMFASLILIMISVGFWSLYNQTFTSLMLFADRNMTHYFLGMSLDAEATQFFNPFFIILLSPILSRLWIQLAPRGLNPSIQNKFSLGVLFICLGYFFLNIGVKYFAVAGLVSPWWLCGSYFLQTIGELLLSPIGLAMITVLCPKYRVGMMMGVWFFSTALSFAIGGSLANIAAGAEKLAPTASALIYSHAFNIYGWIALAMTLISFALLPLLNKLIKTK
jgi:POT family proton-dependent oligopeptide transporter